MYGVEGLEQVISRIDSALNPEKIIQIILEDVSHFVGDAYQYDDMTIVVVKRL